MFDTIKNMLGLGAKVDYAELVQQGAIIVDVRTKGEYAGGHIKGSINIPVDQLSKNLNKFSDKNKLICEKKTVLRLPKSATALTMMKTRSLISSTLGRWSVLRAWPGSPAYRAGS